MKKAQKQSSLKNPSQPSYDPSLIEKKWQKYWEDNKVFSPDIKNAPKLFYNLMMFPYPSAEGMHVGNMYAFTGADVYGRFMRMQGYDVFEPIGLDGFGIHSENYAFKTGRHPMEQAEVSEKNFYRQLRATGNSYDWTRTVETYKPNYYKWTQWLFAQMFKAGLAYRKKAEVNWCPSCKTVLADEQVVTKLKIKNEKSKIEEEVKVCERCESEVIKKKLEQWFFRITEYAERLLNNIEKLDWTEKVKIAQRNWIGKKVGINITYEIEEVSLSSEAASPAASLPPVNARSSLSSSNELRVAGSPSAGVTRSVTVFTTRPDTNFGATFIVVGPEYPGLEDLVTKEQKKEVEKYMKWALSQTDAGRIAQGRKKTGVFTGSYAINNLNGKKLPIWVSDFVLGNVGTGAVVGVPGHDIRDFEFAKAFNLPIVRVVVASDKDESPIERPEQVQEEEGLMVNSEFLNGLDIHVAKEKIMDYLVEKGWGERVITYHLRDWLISRQRYWGPPIPMVFCSHCAKMGKSWFTENKVARVAQVPRVSREEKNKARGTRDTLDTRDTFWSLGWYPVPEDQLPVELPRIQDYKPLGFHSSGEAGSGQGVASPLGAHPEFYTTKCPFCGGEAKRETDVSDTFLDSSWYFFRYVSTDIESEAFDIERVKKWLPVDMYIGGAEHSVLHLLYSRFITMVLNDLGFISFDEPYKRFFAHGLLVKEGAKMSKSKGNVVIPDEYIKKFGADTVRCYLMFLGPFNHGGDFYDTGIEGMNRFLKRVWRLFAGPVSNFLPASARSSLSGKPDPNELRAVGYPSIAATRMMHKTIKKVTEDIQGLRYNTAIAALMEWLNYLSGKGKGERGKLSGEEAEVFLKLLAPFAPHMTEELWFSLHAQGPVASIPPASARSSLSGKPDPNELRAVGSPSSGATLRFSSIHLEEWPTYDSSRLVESVVKIIVQVNGKVRDVIEMKNEKVKMKNEVEEFARKSEKVQKHLEGKNVKDVIYVEGKIINVVVK